MANSPGPFVEKGSIHHLKKWRHGRNLGPSTSAVTWGSDLFPDDRSLYHLVGAGEQRWRHGEAQRLGSLEIDRQLILVRRLHWQVGGLLALENAVDVVRRPPERVHRVGPVGQQPAFVHVIPKRINRGQSVPSGKSDDWCAIR